MSANSQDTIETYNYFIEFIKPTEDDLKRAFSKEELKELCLKQKCKVDGWRWNAVNDYRILFTRSGRYQRWSERDRLRMLCKAVNKMKPSVLYDEEEIARTREKEWKIQLRENILSLNLWKRQAQSKLLLTIFDETDPESEIMSNTFELGEELQIDPNTEPENSTELNTKSENQSTNTQIPQTIEGNIIEADFGAEHIIGESEDLLETIMPSDKQKENPREILHSDEIDTEIGKFYDISTMSMTIDSDISMESQDLGTLRYDCFKSTIPSASTQS